MTTARIHPVGNRVDTRIGTIISPIRNKILRLHKMNAPNEEAAGHESLEAGMAWS